MEEWHGACSVCGGLGGSRVWPCSCVPVQPRRRGHYANVSFNFSVHRPRLLQATEPFRDLPSRTHCSATAEECPVHRGGQSVATIRYLVCCHDYHRRPPGARGWVGKTGPPRVWLTDTVRGCSTENRSRLHASDDDCPSCHVGRSRRTGLEHRDKLCV